MFVVKQLLSVRMAFIVGLIKRAVIKNIFPYFCSSFDDNLLKSELLRIWDFLFPSTSTVLVQSQISIVGLLVLVEKKTIFLLIASTFIVSRTHIFLSLLCDQSGEVFFSCLFYLHNLVSVEENFLALSCCSSGGLDLSNFFTATEFSFDLEILAKWKVCCRVRRKS